MSEEVESYTGLPNFPGCWLDDLVRASPRSKVYRVVEWDNGRLEVVDEPPDDDANYAGWCSVCTFTKELAVALYYEAHDQWASQLNGDPDWVNCVLLPMEERRV